MKGETRETSHFFKMFHNRSNIFFNFMINFMMIMMILKLFLKFFSNHEETVAIVSRVFHILTSFRTISRAAFNLTTSRVHWIIRNEMWCSSQSEPMRNHSRFYEEILIATQNEIAYVVRKYSEILGIPKLLKWNLQSLILTTYLPRSKSFSTKATKKLRFSLA